MRPARGGRRLKNWSFACFNTDNQGVNMAVLWVPLGPKTPALQVPDYGGDMKSWKRSLRGTLHPAVPQRPPPQELFNRMFQYR